MLNWVAKIFRGWFEAILWICLIVFIIVGGVVGHLVGYRDIYTFLGIIVGGIVGFVFIILNGGLVSNFLNMVDNIAEIKSAMNTTGQSTQKNIGKDVTDQKKDEIELLAVQGDSLIVKNAMKLYETELNYDAVVSELKAGEKLQSIKVGANVSVAGITAPMVNVKTEDGKTGWCFSGFLQDNKTP